MIRTLASFVAAGLIGTLVGCNCVHWAGKCDCDREGLSCCTYGRGTPANATVPAPVTLAPVGTIAPTIVKPADPMPQPPKVDVVPVPPKKTSDGDR